MQSHSTANNLNTLTEELVVVLQDALEEALPPDCLVVTSE